MVHLHLHPGTAETLSELEDLLAPLGVQRKVRQAATLLCEWGHGPEATQACGAACSRHQIGLLSTLVGWQAS